jgi:putative hydrolase of the HAD superfamily
MIETVIFDLDDTLFSERQFALSGYRAVHEWQMPRLGLKDFFAVAEEIYNSSNRDRLFNRALEKLEVKDGEKIAGEMTTVFREHIPTLDLHEDAKWALDYLKARGKRMGVISDGYITPQQNKVDVLGLGAYFEKIIYCESFGREFWRPHPLPFQKAMEYFGGAPETFVYVADCPLRDFIAPKKLGWHTIQIERPVGLYYNTPATEEQRAERVIASLRELEKIIQ